MITWGSSPLARGLRDLDNGKYGVDRIIPARAGFTFFRVTVGAVGTDHPRSRGVYLRRLCGTCLRHGSSPLARGLLVTGRRRMCLRGIIPARAGFTGSTATPSGWLTDHPRSRGVYWCHLAQGLCSPGSSPLARGLRQGGLRVLTRTGIIPARAGFTCCVCCVCCVCWDHPRSRGVYTYRSPMANHLEGSSPLARGLPLGVRGTPGPERIIPARAGFTGWVWLAGWLVGDHPRSRGVYRVFVLT